jgi:hypothetical protein
MTAVNADTAAADMVSIKIAAKSVSAKVNPAVRERLLPRI